MGVLFGQSVVEWWWEEKRHVGMRILSLEELTGGCPMLYSYIN
jgi:hypothetical protein